jgi:hypothetical protein
MSEKRSPSTIENEGNGNRNTNPSKKQQKDKKSYDDTPYTTKDLSKLDEFVKSASIATINTQSKAAQDLINDHFNPASKSRVDPQGTIVVQTLKPSNVLIKTTTPHHQYMDTQAHRAFVDRYYVDNLRDSADSWDQHTEGSRAFPGGKRTRKQRKFRTNRSKSKSKSKTKTKTKTKRRNRGSKRIRRK